MVMKGRRPWSREEDQNLKNYVNTRLIGQSWDTAARYLGTRRSGNSCRLRWLNYLSPFVNRGKISDEEMILILELHSELGNRWSKIAERLPRRTDNHIKNFWNTRVKKEAKLQKLDVESAEFRRTMIADLKKRVAVNHPTAVAVSGGHCGGTSAALVTSSTSPTVSIPNYSDLELGVASYSPGSTIDPHPNTGVVDPFLEFGNPSYDPKDSNIGVPSFSSPTESYPNFGTVADGYNDFFPFQEFDNPSYVLSVHDTAADTFISSSINSTIYHPNPNPNFVAGSFSGPTEDCYGTNSIGAASFLGPTVQYTVADGYNDVFPFQKFENPNYVLSAHDTAAGYTTTGSLMSASLTNSTIGHPNPNIVAGSFSGPTDVCYSPNIGIADDSVHEFRNPIHDILGGSGATIGYNFSYSNVADAGDCVGYPSIGAASYLGPTVQYPNIGTVADSYNDVFHSQEFENPNYVLSAHDTAAGYTTGTLMASSLINSTIGHSNPIIVAAGSFSDPPDVVCYGTNIGIADDSFQEFRIPASYAVGYPASYFGPTLQYPNIGDVDGSHQNFGNPPSYVLINSTISHPSIVVNSTQEILPSELGNPGYVSSIHDATVISGDESDTAGTFSSIGSTIDHPINIGDAS